MDLVKWAQAYYKEANLYMGSMSAEIREEDIKITETTLTGTQDYTSATRDFKEFEWLHEKETTLTAQKKL